MMTERSNPNRVMGNPAPVSLINPALSMRMNGSERAESTDFPLRILVSSDMVGAIIGRGGSTIREITQQTKARVDVHRKDNGSPEKSITIYGSAESCSQATRKILQIMTEEAQSTSKGEVSLRILAHNSLIGRIIGKSGSTIKKMMEDTDTKINVSSGTEVSGYNIERVISIRGSIDGMIKAGSLIYNRLKSSFEQDLQHVNNGVSGGILPGIHPLTMLPSIPQMGAARQPLVSSIAPSYSGLGANAPFSLSMLSTPFFPNAPQQEEEEMAYLFVPKGTVGAIIGSKGSFIRRMMQMSGATVKIASADKSDPEPERQVTIFGTPDAQLKAQYMIFTKLREEGFISSTDECRLSIEIPIPTSRVGRIIGKGGTNVRELQRATGAVIKFPTEGKKETSETTLVHITGPFNSLQAAQRRIRHLCTTPPPSGSGVAKP